MEIVWTEEARRTLQEIFSYIRKFFTEKEVELFVLEINKTLNALRTFPKSFPRNESKKYKDTRRVVIHPHSTLFYKIQNKQIILLIFWDNRKNPRKLI